MRRPPDWMVACLLIAGLVSCLFVHLHARWQFSNKLALDAIVIGMALWILNLPPRSRPDLRLRTIGNGIAVDVSNPGDDTLVDRLTLRWKDRADNKRLRWVWLRLYPPIHWDGVLKRNDKAVFTFIMQEGMYMAMSDLRGRSTSVNTYRESSYTVYDGIGDEMGEWKVSAILHDICSSQSAKPQIWLFAGSPVRRVAVILTKQLVPHLQWMADGCKG